MTSCIKIKGKTVEVGDSVYRFDDAGKFSIGNGEVQGSRVKDVEVDWVSGDVQVVYGSGSSVAFTESFKGNLSEDRLLRWYLDGSTLKIRFQKSGIVLGKGESKTLVITLPKGMVLDDLDIDSVSSNISVDVEALDYEMSTVSGSLEVHSSTARKVDFDTVSGNAKLYLSVCPSELDVDSVSGSVYLWIPGNSGFTADMDSVSGGISCSIPAKTDKKRIIAGDGRAEFSMNSVSGNLNIEAI